LPRKCCRKCAAEKWTATNSALGDSLQEAAAASILSATGGFGGFAMDIGKNAIFGTIINAIAADTESNLLATPHIVTLNNQKAKFLVGQEVPVMHVEDSLKSSTAFVGVVFCNCLQLFIYVHEILV
jgi:type II secretory pathway component GspD/PulD (secretin)